MKTLHAKSPCCRGNIIRYGNRRRQCKRCGLTWSVRQKKRGRKYHRRNVGLVVRVIRRPQPLASQQGRYQQRSLATVRWRFRQALGKYLAAPGNIGFHHRAYVLIVDGLWFTFQREDWVLYVMAVKPVGKHFAVFLDPLLLKGKEACRRWRQAIGTIPANLQRRIKAFVSDGFSGSKRIARERGWVHQRCHFHLIAQLQIRRGKRKRGLAGRTIREAIYRTVREALETTGEQRLNRLVRRLRGLAANPQCPKRLTMIVRDFLAELPSFLAYAAYPNPQLPTTTGTIEAMNKIIRSTCRTISTPQSLRQWTTATIRIRHTLTCNAKNYQQN